MKKFVFSVCLLFVILCTSCTDKNIPKTTSLIHAGNIQNGGYIIRINDCYFYADSDDNHNLYKSSIDMNDAKKISYGHCFYEMNLYNDEIYYISSSPGELWKISVDGSAKKRLINQKIGNLLIYDARVYYRLSEDSDWGKLYSADLNGNRKKLLKEKVRNFCIHKDVIYYFDINSNALCSMNIDGTSSKVINKSSVNNIFIQNDMLVYSDNNRKDKLYTYDLKNNVEKCISEDACWDINGNGDWVFYRNQSESGSLYCVSFDGKSKYKLVDGNITDIVILDNKVFYKDINKNNKIESLVFNPQNLP